MTDASQLGLAFASQEETWRAIKRVLDRRQKYLERIGINEVTHHMNEEQKAEFCKLEREVFQMSVEQKKRQASDRDTWRKMPQKAGAMERNLGESAFIAITCPTAKICWG